MPQNLSKNLPSTFPLDSFFKSSEKIIVGKQHELRLALCCLLARGHLLIEDLPGMGKTTFVLTLSRLLDLPYKRIQFTNDLLPADILGLQILSEDRKSFHFHKGPLFSELVLADELNRGTPKTQSALLQAMEERSVTIDGETLTLPEPFFLIATQNPMEHSGVFPLPESQLDRFMMSMALGYPQPSEEIAVLRRGDPRAQIQQLEPQLTREGLLHLQKQVDQVHASDTLLTYVQNLLQQTRSSQQFKMGLSPRSGLLLLQAARAWAFLENRSMVLPEDVKAVAPSVMRHRLPSQGGITIMERLRQLIEQTPIPL